MDFDRELPFSPTCLLEALVPFPPLPAEIIIMVISETPYLDGGETTRTLSLVSKRFRALAKPFYFHSVVICGDDQARVLLRRLKEDPSAAPTLRHLFLSEQALRYFGDWPSTPHAGPHTPHTLDHPRVGPIVGVSYQIATLVSPYLESLCYFDYTIYQTHTMKLPNIFSITFPHLHELTVKCGYNIILDAPLPSLDRFHLYMPNAILSIPALKNLGVVCPRLTHLKITGIYPDHPTVIPWLGQALGVPFSLSWEGEHSCSGLSLLHRIILRPTCGHGGLRGLRQLKLAARMVPHGLVLEVPTPPDMDHWGAKADWLNRLATPLPAATCWTVTFACEK
ncbi:hypothetical protein BOTBODRAFT_176516 [Botryobasidium botryosum FD-172 SS1]|uniref:F-box domain-containing protein n=1 Tax=Botryobasidium botryosum (strain FD-172 SS1) TaxID=930990 RepID=A0A067M924_BOTB1|nr:hypothetical protein BOTBODRAFT_176516 [Botryobasidium botryosum FD-172 SS1]